jgi:hypothetical protein
LLATTEVNRFGFTGFKLGWRKAAALMAAVTEGLFFTLATRAPVIALPSDNCNSVGCFLGDFWLHDKFLFYVKLVYLFI